MSAGHRDRKRKWKREALRTAPSAQISQSKTDAQTILKHADSYVTSLDLAEKPFQIQVVVECGVRMIIAGLAEPVARSFDLQSPLGDGTRRFPQLGNFRIDTLNPFVQLANPLYYRIVRRRGSALRLLHQRSQTILRVGRRNDVQGVAIGFILQVRNKSITLFVRRTKRRLGALDGFVRLGQLSPCLLHSAHELVLARSAESAPLDRLQSALPAFRYFLLQSGMLPQS